MNQSLLKAESKAKDAMVADLLRRVVELEFKVNRTSQTVDDLFAIDDRVTEIEERINKASHTVKVLLQRMSDLEKLFADFGALPDREL